MSVNPFLYLQQHSDRTPDAVFSRTPERAVTYREAVTLVTQFAYELRRLGMRAGDVVAIDLPDALSILVTEAVWHESGITTVIPDGVVIPEVGVRWMLTNRASTPQPGATVVRVDAAFLQHVQENPTGIRPSEVPVDILRIAYSSGTTGTPKAIALSRALEAALDAELEVWFQRGATLTLMDSGTPWGLGEFFFSVKRGQQYLCLGGGGAPAAVRLIELGDARILKGSPAQLAALVDVLEAEGRTLPHIHTVMFAGTVMPPGVAERLRRVTEGGTIIGVYGSTEAGGAAARLYDTDDPFDAGRPQPGSQLEIVDDDDVPVPAGTVGRIRHRSPGMAHEYIGDPAATAEAFRGGWFYPGDRGFFRPDGGLTLTGRETEVLNAGGVKVDPNRLDHAATAFAGVTDAASFEYETASGSRAIGLVVVADPALDVSALIAALRAEVGHAAPTLVARVDAIPRTATGKPKRAELAETYRGR